MHFEILVEGSSDKTALSILLPKLVGEYNAPHTWLIIEHKGIGKIPNNVFAPPNPSDKTLLHNLPSRLRAYGSKQQENFIVIVLVDLDDRIDCVVFKKEMQAILASCKPAPITLFRIAIDEIEAWYLSDQSAILSAYPEAPISLLANYIPDQRIGSWEKLADIVYPGGMVKLQSTYGKRSPRVLAEKKKWAAKITPYLNVETTPSPSLQALRDGLRRYLP